MFLTIPPEGDEIVTVDPAVGRPFNFSNSFG